MSDAPNTAPPGELVRSYLADRDVPCPGCTYNLRGVETPVCPECGRTIELTIARPGRSRGYLLFVLLALGWVLIAGTMNGVRAWDAVRQEASMGQWMVQSFGGRALPGGMSRFSPLTNRSNSSSQTTIMIPSGPASGTSSLIVSGGSISISSNGTLTRRTFTSGAPSYNWSVVSQRAWVVLAWWSGLAIAALAWLTLCLIRRRRFDAERPPRLLMAAAWSLFTLYAGYHAIMFTREFLT